ncbi:TEA/ATTS domain family-domain-containing protein [Dipodascopsis uninucleata]
MQISNPETPLRNNEGAISSSYTSPLYSSSDIKSTGLLPSAMTNNMTMPGAISRRKTYDSSFSQENLKRSLARDDASTDEEQDYLQNDESSAISVLHHTETPNRAPLSLATPNSLSFSPANKRPRLGRSFSTSTSLHGRSFPNENDISPSNVSMAESAMMQHSVSAPGLTIDTSPIEVTRHLSLIDRPAYNQYLARQRRENGDDGSSIWSADVEEAFMEAIHKIPKVGRRKITVNNRPCGRNELISDFIYRKTGKLRTRKQVSSHIQVLKHLLKDDTEFMNLVSDTPSTTPTRAIFPSPPFDKSSTAILKSNGDASLSNMSSQTNSTPNTTNDMITPISQSNGSSYISHSHVYHHPQSPTPNSLDLQSPLRDSPNDLFFQTHVIHPFLPSSDLQPYTHNNLLYTTNAPTSLNANMIDIMSPIHSSSDISPSNHSRALQLANGNDMPTRPQHASVHPNTVATSYIGDNTSNNMYWIESKPTTDAPAPRIEDHTLYQPHDLLDSWN